LGHATDEGVILAGMTPAGAQRWVDFSGDGTVPSWSILEAARQCRAPIQTKPFQGSHVGILITNAFRQFLYSYFKLKAPALFIDEGRAGIVVSLNKHTYYPNETMDVILIPDEEAREIAGSLILCRVIENGRSSHVGVLQDLEIRGGRVRHLVSKVTAPHAPGVYRLDFGGANASHRSSSELAGWFTVQRTELFQG